MNVVLIIVILYYCTKKREVENWEVHIQCKYCYSDYIVGIVSFYYMVTYVIILLWECVGVGKILWA